eukprot:jgi/Ulvmu1/8759/UM048_0013.1
MVGMQHVESTCGLRGLKSEVMYRDREKAVHPAEGGIWDRDERSGGEDAQLAEPRLAVMAFEHYVCISSALLLWCLRFVVPRVHSSCSTVGCWCDCSDRHARFIDQATDAGHDRQKIGHLVWWMCWSPVCIRESSGKHQSAVDGMSRPLAARSCSRNTND